MAHPIATEWLTAELDYCVEVGAVTSYTIVERPRRSKHGTRERRFVVTLPDDEVRDFSTSIAEAFALGVRWGSAEEEEGEG